MAKRQAHGFTLFEIGISLVILSVGVVSTLLLFPTGIKAQQMARFKLFACAKAEEMVEAFNAIHNCNTNIDGEAPDAWDVTVSRRSMAQDLEARLASPQFGIMPLPLTIAGRIDSDNDEIAQIISGGGYVYYSQPMATTSVIERALDNVIATETQKLIFAVSGAPQSNALHMLPQKAWPYYYPYPSPPAHGEMDPSQFLAPGTFTFKWPDFSAVGGLVQTNYCWEVTNDSDIIKVFRWDENGTTYGFQPYAYQYGEDESGAVRYLQSALWYCAKKGLPSSYFDPASTNTPLADFSGAPAVPDWQQTNAMRFLAHAAACLTRWHDLAALGGQPSINPGLNIPSVTLDGFPSPALELTHDKITWYHESSMRLGTRFAAYHPYDFGAPRPLQRAMMMDCPLIEYDLFSSPHSGVLYSTAVAAEQWSVIPGNPVDNLGRSFSFPDRDIPATIWGDSSHFTLTEPFEAAERCRQIVFWAADWQSYEDFELAPSAPVDASRYDLTGVVKNLTFDDRMSYLRFNDPSLHTYRNPEKNLTFKIDVSNRLTGDSIADTLIDNVFEVPTGCDQGISVQEKSCFSGLYGADRNFNRQLDRGPIPPSVRIRAQLVGRFNYYDTRVSHSIR